jgi:hypothetical protein
MNLGGVVTGPGPSYGISWNTVTATNGNHTLSAVASDAAGNTATSSVNVTVNNLGPPPLFVLHGDPSEVSGTTNGSVVTPPTAPPGFTGTVVVKGSGSVNFASAQSGNGVYFLSCCTNTNAAYYKFPGAAVGNIFNVNTGEISFDLKSRYSFTQRQASASAPRYTFDVRDTSSRHLFFFYTQVIAGYLQFTYALGGGPQFYYVPQASADALFGNGVTLKVRLTWDGAVMKLYLNGVLVKSSAYSKITPGWTASSNFNVGAYEYLTVGGYNSSDDIIDEFQVK